MHQNTFTAPSRLLKPEVLREVERVLCEAGHLFDRLGGKTTQANQCYGLAEAIREHLRDHQK